MKTIKDTDYGDLTGKYYNGNIDLYKFGLTSLEGFPDKVTGDVLLQSNKITSLKGSPVYVGGDFYLDKNDLESLEFAPKEIGGKFSCQGCGIDDAMEQILKYQIKASGYYIDSQMNAIHFSEIEDDFKRYSMGSRVTRPSMRTLLGLK